MAKEERLNPLFIQKLNRGDSQAFDQLFADTHQQVYAYCLRLIRSKELAEEVMMDVFLTVWKKRAQLRADRSLDAFLFKIAKDLCFNCLKKLAREQARQVKFQDHWSHPTYDPIGTQMLTQEYDRVASTAINELPPQRRIIFTMRRQMDMSTTEIAEQLGISKNTVKVQLAKASKFLREYVMTHTDISFVLVLSMLFF